jgi:alkylhydroperoxidase family enzyme
VSRLDLVGNDSSDEIVGEVFANTLQRAGEVPNLYRTLAHSPSLLAAWTGFTWPLRDAKNVPRRLSELSIMRMAQMAGAAYELAHHRPMALNHGVRAAQLDQLEAWEISDEFDDEERAVLRFADAVASSNVDDHAFADIVDRFSPAGAIELTLTASFYYGVLPRVVQACQIDLESKYQERSTDG